MQYEKIRSGILANIPSGIIDVKPLYKKDNESLKFVHFVSAQSDETAIKPSFNSDFEDINFIKVDNIQEWTSVVGECLAAEPLALFIIFISKEIDIDKFDWNKFQTAFQKIQISIVTLPKEWSQNQKWLRIEKDFRGYLQVRYWEDLEQHNFECEKKYLIKGGHRDLEAIRTCWNRLKFFEKLKELRIVLLHERKSLTAVRIANSLKLKSLTAKKASNKFIEIKKQIDFRFDQLNNFMESDWNSIFSLESGDWLKEINSAIENIPKFDLTEKKGETILFINESIIEKINDHFQNISEEFLAQYLIYEKTTLTICNDLLVSELKTEQFKKREINNADILDNLSIPSDLFEAKIPVKGLMYYLMASRRAPMYLFMFFSMLAMSGVSIYAYRNKPWFQVIIFSLVIFGGLYAWYQAEETKKKAIEEQTEKAKSILMETVAKLSKTLLKNVKERILNQKDYYRKLLSDAEQKQKQIDEVELSKRLVSQKFLEESIRQKSEQERQLDTALRQLDSIEHKEKRPFSEPKKLIKTTQKKVLNGTTIGTKSDRSSNRSIGQERK